MNELIEKLDIPIGMALLNRGTDIEINLVNNEFSNMTGYKLDGLNHTLKAKQLIYSEDWHIFSNALSDFLDKQIDREYKIRLLTYKNALKWVKIRLTKNNQDDNQILLVLLNCDDEKHLEDQLKLLNHQYELMEQVSDEIPFDYDIRNNKLLRSYRIMQMRGEEECIDKYFDFDEEIKNIHPLDREVFVEAMKEAVEEKISASIEARYNMAKKGSSPHYVWLRILYKSIQNDQGEIVRVIGRSHNVEQDMLLQDRVRRDPLTNLLNKVEVEIEVQDILKKNPEQTHVLFVIDIDNFKGINDTFGHTFGDTVICDVALELKSLFRSNDVIGRVGGDEFVVFMKNIDAEKAEIKAQNVCSLLSKEYSGDNVIRCITASIGLAISGADGDTYQDLFEKADHAMYRAKKSGKNGYRTAEKEDVGPLKRSERVSESRGPIKVKDRDFLAFAINILSHARNIDGSLNLLLEQMLTKYKIEEITVCEEMNDEKNFILTNYAGKRVEFFSRTIFPACGLKNKLSYDENIKEFDHKYIREWSEIAIKQGIAIPKECIENVGLLAGKFETSNGRCGICCFYSFDRNRVWSESELNILGELTRIIGVFVSLRSRMDQNNALLRSIQNRDLLTGLYNLDSFKKEYKKVIEQYFDKELLCLAYFDLNNFGYINENYGYQIGDKVLKYLAQNIKETEGAIMACRLYSDFFVLLLKGENRSKIKNALMDKQRHFVNLHNHQYPSSGINITTGLCFIDDKKVDLDVIIENANLAWKKAKKNRGSKYWIFDNMLRMERSEEQHIVGEFYEALYRGDFVMYLQPKFNIVTGEVYGAEALARWKKPNGNIISPIKFVESLERIGYITELDFYIFEELLKTLTKWEQCGNKKIIVSVNFSGRHFENDGTEFIRRITTIMNKYNIEPAEIEIEITEGVMVKNFEVLCTVLNKLRASGFRVAIDDFGTGYSSLSVLTDIPADVIKIDKSFIDKELSEQNADILKCIGKLVNISGREILFEGVETEAQRQFLKNCGFIYAQGYLCNAPINTKEFERLYL